MAIETLDDVIDQLADWVGVYGAHDDGSAVRSHDERHCRVCFHSVMRNRLVEAFKAERVQAMLQRLESLERSPPTQEGHAED